MRLAMAVSVVGLGLGSSLTSQVTVDAAPSAGTYQTFASPWSITFDKIQAAMTTRLGGIAIRQTRRVRTVDATTGQVSYPGTLEQLRFRPATATMGYRFQLEFKGLEGRTLRGTEFQAAAKKFARRAAFKFEFGSFRVANPTDAARNYHIVFLRHGVRSTTTGPRHVYRVAVLPKRWNRGSFVLELDALTGYPLYSGQYGLDEQGRSRLDSELIVTSFETGMRFPNNTAWWTPTQVVTSHPSEQAALQVAFPQTNAFVVPSASIHGYGSLRNEVHLDPYKIGKAAVLVYSDGLDHVVVRQVTVPRQPRGQSDTVAYWDQGGVSQCLFRHHGVEFLLVGRANRRNLRDISAQLFARAITTLK